MKKQITKKDRIRELLELIDISSVAEEAIRSSFMYIIATYKQNTGNELDSEFIENLYAEVIHQINYECLTNEIISLYDKYYDETDIKVLLKFQKTPTGQKTTHLKTAFTSEFMFITQAWLAQKIPTIIPFMEGAIIKEVAKNILKGDSP